MSRREHNSGYGHLATFTVCADSELSNMAMSAQAYAPGVEFAGEFQDYITSNRKPHFPPALKQAHSCVAFIDFDRHPEHAIETADILRSSHSPRIISVGVSSVMDTDLLLRAMRAGCSEFLEKPIAPARFQATLQDIQNRLLSSIAPMGTRGQVISLFGAKGGVGTTTLSVHLATCLAKVHGKKVLLVDQHHQLGHVCLYLGIKDSHYHFDELIRNVERLDSDLLKGFVIKHASGVDVLASPDARAARYGSSREDVKQVLEFLREEYEFILIDSSLAQEDMAAATIEYSDEVTLIVTPDVAALRDISRHVTSLNLADEGGRKLQVIVNRRTSSDTIGPEQIEKAIRCPVSLSIPDNYVELVRAMNSGEPVSLQRRSEFTTQISKWANRLTHAGVKTESPSSKKKFAFWK